MGRRKLSTKLTEQDPREKRVSLKKSYGSKNLDDNLKEIHIQYIQGEPVHEIGKRFGVDHKMITKHARTFGWDKERKFVWEAARNVYLEAAIENVADLNDTFASGWKHFAQQVHNKVGPQLNVDTGKLEYPDLKSKELKDYAYIFLMAHKQLEYIMGGPGHEHVERIEITYSQGSKGLKDIAAKVIRDHEGSMHQRDGSRDAFHKFDKALTEAVEEGD